MLSWDGPLLYYDITMTCYSWHALASASASQLSPSALSPSACRTAPAAGWTCRRQEDRGAASCALQARSERLGTSQDGRRLGGRGSPNCQICRRISAHGKTEPTRPALLCYPENVWHATGNLLCVPKATSKEALKNAAQASSSDAESSGRPHWGEDATDIVQHDKFALVALDKTQHLQVSLQRHIEGSGSRLAEAVHQL